jgi:SPP1 family predicted phage head-tail adaptor
MWSLRHRVDIQQRVQALGPSGEQVDTWQAVSASEPAAVEPLRGREAFAALQVSTDQPYKIVVRYRPDLRYLPTMRVVWEGRALDIESVAEEMAAGHYIHLHCRERSPQGFRE